jgi:hypothetical protein
VLGRAGLAIQKAGEAELEGAGALADELGEPDEGFGVGGSLTARGLSTGEEERENEESDEERRPGAPRQSDLPPSLPTEEQRVMPHSRRCPRRLQPRTSFQSLGGSWIACADMQTPLNVVTFKPAMRDNFFA